MSTRLSIFIAATFAATMLTAVLPVAARGDDCLPMGTAGLPELLPDRSDAGYDALAPAATSLPDQVWLRGTTETFNRRWAFALRKGLVYVKPAAAHGGWRTVALPSCLAGRVTGISVDDDEMLALDGAGNFFTMTGALNAPRTWNWTRRYGTPLWLGPGNHLPAGTRSWSWSVLSPTEDGTWRDTAGHDHHVGSAKVSHVYALSADGRRIVYLDPWLPVDDSYATATPDHGRFVATALSTSGSQTLVISRSGDMYTRLYDFDISGADTVFFRYSYGSQAGKPSAPDEMSERLDPRYAAIQLPPPGWIHQPRIPGVITDRISISKTGPGSDARELRVEGRHSGHTGYWRKRLTDTHWSFVTTDLPLTGQILTNTAAADVLAAPSGSTYAYRSPAGWTAVLESFDVDASPTPLQITIGGTRLDVLVHTVDGLRQLPIASGLTDQPRTLDATIEIPAEVLNSLDRQPAAVRDFVARYLGNRRFTDTPAEVTDTQFGLPGIGLTLSRTG